MIRSVLVFAFAAACAQAVPSCRSNEGEPGRFPLWPPTYDMRDSTIIQPCNMSGFLNASLYAQFGIVSGASFALIIAAARMRRNEHISLT